MSELACTLSGQFVSVSLQKFDATFQLVNNIGSGSFGDVYEANIKYGPDSLFSDQISRNFNKIKVSQPAPTSITKVAIKKFKNEALWDKGRILNEAKIIQNLKNPYLIEYVGCYKVEGKCYIVTNFCQNRSLEDQKQRVDAMTNLQKLKICLQISQGILALHQQNIMHRDIKPDNILFDQNMNIKICDFGCSKLENQLQQTQSIGSPLFWDPQVQFGKYTKKCDIFSLGLVMYRIFAGRYLFENVRSKPELKNSQNNFFKDPQSFYKFLHCSQDVKQIISMMLKKHENERLDAKSLVSDLRKSLEKEQKDLELKKKSNSLISTVFQTQQAQKFDEMDSLTVELITLRSNAARRKLQTDYRRIVLTVVGSVRGKVEKLKEIEKLRIQDYQKKCLAFFVLFYYMRFLYLLERWLLEQIDREESCFRTIPIPNLSKEFENVKLERELMQQLLTMTGDEQSRWKGVLFSISQQISAPVKVKKDEIGSQFLCMINDIEQAMMSKILNYDQQKIKQLYRTFFATQCPMRDNTTDKQTYQFVRNYLDEFITPPTPK